MACSTWSPHFASIELELLDFRQKDQDGVGKLFGDPIRRRFALGQPQLREPSGALAPATALFERALRGRSLTRPQLMGRRAVRSDWLPRRRGSPSSSTM